MVALAYLAPLAGVIPAVLAQSPVSDAVFANIQKYTAFAAASYSPDCPNPPQGSQIVRFFNDSGTDTQAYLFRLGSELILSFRGSSSPQDLDTDLNFGLTAPTLPGVSCPTCLVHQGFQDALLSILPAVRASVIGANPLTVVGHSLGGGLASLAAAVLSPNSVYTFGEPRNGNQAWGSLVESRVPATSYYRVTHANDGVPQIPPTSLSYAHHGTEYWESRSTGNNAGSTKMCAPVNGAENTRCNAATNYGQTPINGAHIQYTDMIVAAMLYNPGCGFTDPS